MSRSAVSCNQDWNLQIQYNWQIWVSNETKWVTFVNVTEEDLKEIKKLEENVQSELNRILSKYINL